MKIGSKHQPAEIRRQQIISAADQLLTEVGIEDFTIDQVAERADVAKGTVYKYFKSKDEILAEVTQKALSLLLEAFKQKTAPHSHSVDKIRAVCHAAYAYYQTYPVYYQLINHLERPEFEIDSDRYVALSNTLQDFIQNIVREGQARKEINPDLNPYLVNIIVWSCNIGVIQFVKTRRKIIEKMYELPLEDTIDTFATMITRGLNPPE